MGNYIINKWLQKVKREVQSLPSALLDTVISMDRKQDNIRIIMFMFRSCDHSKYFLGTFAYLLCFVSMLHLHCQGRF